ncbi:MAG: diacylglycerol/lipid kinase family protein, partial [Candidatus Binataceae bacterium]
MQKRLEATTRPLLVPGARVGLVVNEKAGVGGPGTERAQRVAGQLTSHGLQVEFHVAATASEIKAAAQRCAKSGVAIVVAAGGDGTVNGVAAELAGTQTVLGILPF